MSEKTMMKKGKISHIEYGRTFNLGEFESEHIRLRFEFPEEYYPLLTDKNIQTTFIEVKNMIFQLHHEGQTLDHQFRAAQKELEQEPNHMRTFQAPTGSSKDTPIIWTQTEGPKGPYEKSQDINNPIFHELLDDLKKHAGRMSYEGYFYWLWEDNQTVGRKKTGR